MFLHASSVPTLGRILEEIHKLLDFFAHEGPVVPIFTMDFQQDRPHRRRVVMGTKRSDVVTHGHEDTVQSSGMT
ncbi:hypothetical protein [Arthrobacter sp. R4-81]